MMGSMNHHFAIIFDKSRHYVTVSAVYLLPTYAGNLIIPRPDIFHAEKDMYPVNWLDVSQSLDGSKRLFERSGD